MRFHIQQIQNKHRPQDGTLETIKGDGSRKRLSWNSRIIGRRPVRKRNQRKQTEGKEGSFKKEYVYVRIRLSCRLQFFLTQLEVELGSWCQCRGSIIIQFFLYSTQHLTSLSWLFKIWPRVKEDILRKGAPLPFKIVTLHFVQHFYFQSIAEFSHMATTD